MSKYSHIKKDLPSTEMTFSRLGSQHIRHYYCLHPRLAALTAAVYCLCSSILVVLIYSWRISVITSEDTLKEVFYGVEISYIAILVSHIVIIFLSVILLQGIHKESESSLATWVIASISLMALEGVCCVYSNVLRDHVNKGFDHFCKAELTFYLSRMIINIFALWSVLRFFRLIREGVSFIDPEAIEL